MFKKLKKQRVKLFISIILYEKINSKLSQIGIQLFGKARRQFSDLSQLNTLGTGHQTQTPQGETGTVSFIEIKTDAVKNHENG